MTQNDCKELYNVLIESLIEECINLQSLFLINKAKTFTCKYDHKASTNDVQLFLVIPSKTKIDSEKCIQDIKREIVELELICEDCGYANKLTVETKSLALPQYLVFYIADTSNQGRVPKVNIHSKGKHHELFRVICYYGSGNSGHYIAFTLNSDGKWIKYNDAFGDRANPDYDHAYMLFYRQKL